MMRVLTLFFLFLIPITGYRTINAGPGLIRHAGTPAKGLDLPEKHTKKLANQMNERLSYMKDVAAYKWEHQLPIEDLAREKVVLESSLTQAMQLGLDTTSIRTYFQLQIDMAKQVQQYWFASWQKNGNQPYTYADLNSVIRPALLGLSNDMLQTVLQLEPWKYQDQKSKNRARRIFEKAISITGIRKLDKCKMFEAVWKIRLAH
ncbi:MAG: gamma subclass chorismate mutase AroQ [Saprospiraceae bacterium]|nr:gamma subclass chorismate mutase AroQ [Saprospiraceae bacterium]